MIRLGLAAENDKLAAIKDYMMANAEIKHVIVFSPPQFWLAGDWEQYTYADIIMYKVFYPLLEKVDRTYLIVVNECLRTQNRSDLTYNCLHHYLNQTPHHMVFEYFPFVDTVKDFMILVDDDHPSKYKGKGFSPEILSELDVDGIVRTPNVGVISVPIGDDVQSKYEHERDRLFDTLGNKDPDTIPRTLHLWCGKLKLSVVTPDKLYVARNKRLKRDNIATYKEIKAPEHRISIDLPYRQMDMNDYLKTSGESMVQFLSTGLSVDNYYEKTLKEWTARLEEFYATAGIRR